MESEDVINGIPQSAEDLIRLKKLKTFFYKIVYNDYGLILLINYSKGFVATKNNLKEFTKFSDLTDFIYSSNLYLKNDYVVDYKSIETQIEKTKINLFKKDD